jgi:hypothetical protein
MVLSVSGIAKPLVLAAAKARYCSAARLPYAGRFR